jgi:hypothetical protein
MQYINDVASIENDNNDEIPIYQNILDMLDEFKFDKHLAEKYIKANKHNKETTIYYLLLKKNEKLGKELILKVNDDDEDLFEDERNQTQQPKYTDDLSISQKIKSEYLPNSHLNQTLPASNRNQEPLAPKTYEINLYAPKHHVYMETSRAEQQPGINVSYDNSFTAIKKEVQKTVQNAKSPVPNIPKSSTPSTNARNKQIAEDNPPNKPNEAIMISENVKVPLNYTMDQPLHTSIGDMRNRDSQVQDQNTTLDAANVGSKKTSINFNTTREEKPGSTGSTLPQNKQPKSNIKAYGAAMPKKKGHVTNLSYSSRPKTTQYLTNGSQNENPKPSQTNSFMTQSMDNSKTPKQIENKVKSSMHTYDDSKESIDQKDSAAAGKDASNSERRSRHSRLPKGHNRPKKPNEFASFKESDESKTPVPSDNDQEMKTYRGPFSVSCSTTKDPKVILNDMVKSLNHHSVSFERKGKYFVKCQKQAIKFEMELTKMENLEFVYIVRILRTGGDITKYKDLASRVLSAMKL